MTVSTHQKLGESFYILAKPFTPYHLIYFLNLNFASPPQNFFILITDLFKIQFGLLNI